MADVKSNRSRCGVCDTVIADSPIPSPRKAGRWDGPVLNDPLHVKRRTRAAQFRARNQIAATR
jgi:hypothetical protein